MVTATAFFLDTSVLLAGLIEGLGPSSRASGELLARLAEGPPGGKTARAATAWHCCLEFYAVSTRLPEEFRLEPAAAAALLGDGVLARMNVFDIDPKRRAGFLQSCALAEIRGGRLYDAHIGEIARRSGARFVVTDNLRHFAELEKTGIAVMDAAGAIQALTSGKGQSR